MTLRVWGRSLLTALGVGALAGAGQLGLAYGLGIVVWRQDYQTGSPNAWYAQLAWVCAIAVMAVLAGTAAAVSMIRRLSVDPAELARQGLHPDDLEPRSARPAVNGRDFAISATLAVVAAIGALIVLPLTMLPAREARPLGIGHPADAVQSVATWGLALGVLVAAASTMYRSIGWSISATAGWLWLAGLIAAIRDITMHTTGEGERLGLPLTPDAAHSAGNTLVLLILLAVGLILGTSVAASAASRREAPALVIASGIAGPILIMVLYLVAGKGVHTTGPAATDHLVPYRSAPFGALLALFGAVFVAIMTQRRPQRAGAGDSTAVLGVAAPRHLAAGGSDSWRSSTTQSQTIISHRAGAPTPVSPALGPSIPISAPPAGRPSPAPATAPRPSPPPARPVSAPPAIPSQTAPNAAADEWPGGRDTDEWPGGRGVATPPLPTRQPGKARDRRGRRISDWTGGSKHDADPTRTGEQPRIPAAAASSEPPRIYAVPSEAVAAKADEPSRRRGLFRRSGAPERRQSSAAPVIASPALDLPPIEPASGTLRPSVTGNPTTEPMMSQRFSTAKPARTRIEAVPDTPAASGSLFTPVEPVHTRSRSGLFSHTDSHPIVTPAEKPAPDKAAATRKKSDAPARVETATRSEPAAPAPAVTPPPPPNLPRGRKAKKADKAARAQARIDYERSRGDDEFEDWLGKIASPKTPAGRRKQISEDDDD